MRVVSHAYLVLIWGKRNEKIHGEEKRSARDAKSEKEEETERLRRTRGKENGIEKDRSK